MKCEFPSHLPAAIIHISVVWDDYLSSYFMAQEMKNDVMENIQVRVG